MNIVVVGASRGIGKYLADSLEGRVLRIARRTNGGYCFKADVTDYQEMENCAHTISSWGYVDALIYCAATQGKIGPAMSMTCTQWSYTIDVNLNGFFNTMKVFHGLLLKAERPRVIAFSGGGATKARQMFSAYGASKCALVRMVETLSEELPQIMINAIAPGAIYTDMMLEVMNAGPEVAGQKEYNDATKAQKEATEALDLVKFLLSIESQGITGRLIAAKWDNWKQPGFYANDTGLLRRVEA